MLSLLEESFSQTVAITGEAKSDKARALAEFYRDHIHSRAQKVKRLNLEAGVMSVALDRALYDDESEKSAWEARQEAAENALSELQTDADWKKNVATFESLAEGQTGKLADYARRLAARGRLEFGERELPVLQKVNKLAIEIAAIAKSWPHIEQLADVEREGNDIEEKFFAGDISFADAWPKLEALQARGRTAHGQFIAEEAERHLQEVAELFTQLAVSKGFKTWAEYQMAVQAEHHADGFKTADERIRFLRDLLEKTDRVYEQFMRKQADLVGYSFDELRLSQLRLLRLQDASLMRPFLQKEKIVPVWRQAMLQAGFTSEQLRTVHLDVFPRSGKYTHAYMANVTEHQPRTLSISLADLNVTASSSSSADWDPAQIYVVQNFRDNGPNAWRTAWHEGGHVLNFLVEEDLLGRGAAYGFVETPSMSMEHMIHDLDFLEATAVATDGSRPTRSVLETFVRNATLNELADFRGQVANALLDLEVWNVPYAKGVSFVHTLKDTFGILRNEAAKAAGATVEGVDFRSGAFATGHFYSGNVRYIGYIFAWVAAQEVVTRIGDILRTETGRPTLHNQPGLARILTDGLLQKGFEPPFPRQIEAFTGRPFSPEALVAKMVGATRSYCQETLVGLAAAAPGTAPVPAD